MLTRKPIQLLIIALVTLVAAAIILLDIKIPLVRPLLTVFLIMAVGHTTLLAWGNHLALRGVVRVLMTIMLGITIVMVSGFILNFSTWGLVTRTWVFFIAAIIFFNSLVALLRKQTASDVPTTSIQTWKLELNARQFILLALAVVVAGASLVVARTGAFTEPTAQFSQFWMVPDTTVNTSQAVVGVKNEEQQPLTYRVVVMQGTNVLQEFPSISLAPNETWQTKYDLAAVTDTTVPVEAVLYRGDDQTNPYRTASLWLQ